MEYILNKYIVILFGSILSLFSFTAYAAWHCDPYTNVCYQVHYNDENWQDDDGYYWRKHVRKKPVYKNTEPKHVFVAPPEKIAEKNIVKINLTHGTWGAYDSEGTLVNSGKISGGKSYCPDIGKACKTATGTFTVYDKRGAKCKSKIFPVGKGGAPMPYCMFFHQGYAMHGSNSVPNYNASHGCIRMSPTDAKWLSDNFVKVGSTRVNVSYEKIIPTVEEKVVQKKAEKKTELVQ